MLGATHSFRFAGDPLFPQPQAVPEFYCDASIFCSIHPELTDLAPPRWADSPADFVARHRAALESAAASAGLSAWIDLTFGCALDGQSAVRNKNVLLPTDRGNPQRWGHPSPDPGIRAAPQRRIAVARLEQ